VHLKPELGDHRLEELRAEHVQRFLAACTKQGLAPRTVSHLRATLRAALNVAMGLRLVDHNAALYARPPRIPRTRVKPLDPEEAVKMVEKLKDHRLGPLFTVALAVGLRSSEARGLTWADIDWERHVLTARHQLERIDGEYVLQDELKNVSSVRTVRLPQIAIDALKRHQQRQEAERTKAGDMWSDAWGLVFCDVRGRPLNDSSLTRTFHQLLADAGVRDQRFHDLRHGCASLLIAAGANLKEVSEALGHSSTSITAALYWHLFEAAELKTASRMDAIFAPKSEPMVINEVISPDQAATA
jgi:integrase